MTIVKPYIGAASHLPMQVLSYGGMILQATGIALSGIANTQELAQEHWDTYAKMAEKHFFLPDYYYAPNPADHPQRSSYWQWHVTNVAAQSVLTALSFANIAYAYQHPDIEGYPTIAPLQSGFSLAMLSRTASDFCSLNMSTRKLLEEQEKSAVEKLMNENSEFTNLSGYRYITDDNCIKSILQTKLHKQKEQGKTFVGRILPAEQRELFLNHDGRSRSSIQR